jgi:hypothetical protein
VSCIDRRLGNREEHAGSITGPLRHLPVTESFALPPDKGVQHDTNPISYDPLSDVSQDHEAYAREGIGRP